ncbi:MAG: FKBP-type peptidyl-prolyl cis-trans isomerase [Nanobdellota archaeon]
MKVENGDFIELDYTGKTKEEGIVFDTTDKKTAIENGLKQQTEPIIIWAGNGQVMQGLDEDLIGKEIGKDYSVEIKPEKAFGKKDAKKVQLIAATKFKKENINPQPGMQVNVDDNVGIVKTVTGGRVMVDFNHPLSGKDIIYDYRINRKVEKLDEKIKGYFRVTFNLDVDVEVKEGECVIKTDQDIPEELQKNFNDKLKEIEDTEYKFEKKESKGSDQSS